MTTATLGAVRIAPATVRVRPDQKYAWNDCSSYRRGPWDGAAEFWMIRRRVYGGERPWAVRIVIDEDAPTRTHMGVYYALEEACEAERIAAEDDYLHNLMAVAAVPADELVRLRQAVASGEAGGAADGAPKKRRRTTGRAS